MFSTGLGWLSKLFRICFLVVRDGFLAMTMNFNLDSFDRTKMHPVINDLCFQRARPIGS